MIKKILIKYANYLIIGIAFILISFTIGLMVNHVGSIYKIDSNNNSAFSNNSISFKITKIEQFNYKNIKSKDIALYSIADSNVFSTYNILCTNQTLNVANNLKVDKKLLFTNSKVAIIGSLVSKYTDISNLLIDNYKYNVIKTFNSKEVKSNNYAVFYINGNEQSISPRQKMFVIDGKDKSEIFTSFNLVKNEVVSQGGEISVIVQNRMTVSNFVQYRLFIFLLIVFIIAILVFTNIMINIFLFNSIQRELSVKYLLGKKYIRLNVSKNVILLTIVTTTLGFLFVLLFSDNLYYVAFSYLITLLINLSINLVSSVVTFAYYGKIEVNTILEEDNE